MDICLRAMGKQLTKLFSQEPRQMINYIEREIVGGEDLNDK